MPVLRSSAIEGAAVTVVSVPRIELYPADFVGIQTLACFWGDHSRELLSAFRLLPTFSNPEPTRMPLTGR